MTKTIRSRKVCEWGKNNVFNRIFVCCQKELLLLRMVKKCSSLIFVLVWNSKMCKYVQMVLGKNKLNALGIIFDSSKWNWHEKLASNNEK